jgi:hypothetical protein
LRRWMPRHRRQKETRRKHNVVIAEKGRERDGRLYSGKEIGSAFDSIAS